MIQILHRVLPWLPACPGDVRPSIPAPLPEEAAAGLRPPGGEQLADHEVTEAGPGRQSHQPVDGLLQGHGVEGRQGGPQPRRGRRRGEAALEGGGGGRLSESL